MTVKAVCQVGGRPPRHRLRLSARLSRSLPQTFSGLVRLDEKVDDLQKQPLAEHEAAVWTGGVMLS